MYGCLGLTAKPVTCSICPINVNFNVPDAVSHIFIVLSADPVTNHSLPGSKAMDRTHLFFNFKINRILIYTLNDLKSRDSSSMVHAMKA